jgi:hypothetical protein
LRSSCSRTTCSCRDAVQTAYHARRVLHRTTDLTDR